MSPENLGLAYRVVDAFNRRDFDALLELMDEEIEAVPILVVMEGGYHGHAGIRRWWEDLLDVFPDYSAEVAEAREVGEFTLGALRARGHGRGSDTPFEDVIWLLATWRQKKVVRWEVFRSEAEALESVGLLESSRRRDL